MDCERWLPTKGLNFCITCKKLDYRDYIIYFEFFRDKGSLDILSNKDLDFVKAKTKETALSSYWTYYDNVQRFKN